MLKESLNEEEVIIVNELSNELYSGATGAYQGLETMRLLTLNLKLECGRLAQLITDLGNISEITKEKVQSHLGDVAALNEVGTILSNAITDIELATMGGRDVAKALGKLVNKE